jgi:ATP-binding cassette subfamily B protein
MLGFLKKKRRVQKNATGLAKVEAIYFPSMTLLIGLSTLLTIMIGGIHHIHDPVKRRPLIVEFVIILICSLFLYLQ